MDTLYFVDLVSTKPDQAQAFRKTWSVEPKPHGGGIEPHIPEDRLDEFKAIIDNNRDAYLAELAE